MKHLLLSFIIGLICLPAWGQDLGILASNMQDFTEVKAGIRKNIGLEIKFLAPTDEEAFAIQYTIDGGEVMTSLGNVPVQNVVSNPGYLFCPVQLPNKVDDTVVVALFANLADDTNRVNDTFKIKLVLIEKAPYDLEATILTPVDGAEVPTGIEQTFTVVLRNVGTEDFPSGAPLLHYLSVGGLPVHTPTVTPYAGATIKPGGSGSWEFTHTFSEGENGQDIALCQFIYWAEVSDTAINTIDGNIGDNAACGQYRLVPNSIDDHEALTNNVSAYFKGQQLVVHLGQTLESHPTTLRVFNTTGQLLAERHVPAGVQQEIIRLPKQNSGVFFVQLGHHTAFKVLRF